MRVSTAFTAAALGAGLLAAVPAPASAASLTLATSRPTVVVGERGAGVWTTFTAKGASDSVKAMDLWFTAPDGERTLLDIVRRAPGVWSADTSFNRFDTPGKWTAVLYTRDASGAQHRADDLVFHVKRRTTLTTSAPANRGAALSGVLRRLGDAGGYVPYAGQKVRLYRWTGGAWRLVATAETTAKGRYAFAKRAGRLQIRYAGTSVNAAAQRTP